jgi:hypothetical protein
MSRERIRERARLPAEETALEMFTGLAADPASWGPVMWDLLFCAAFRDASHEAAARIAELLPAALPCPSCRASCEAFCKHLPPSAIREGDVAQWLWTLKDTVNQKLRKTTRPYREVKRRYAAFPALHSDATVLTLCVVVAFGGDDARASQVCRFFEALVAIRPSLAAYMQPKLAEAMAGDPTGADVLGVAVSAVVRHTGQPPDLDQLAANILVESKQARRPPTHKRKHAP